MLDYKADLMRHYAAGSISSILAALNRFLRMIAREDCRVHRLRIQYQAYSPEEREITAQEYADLVRTARETGRARLALVLQTICATGIRVSELPAITAEAARRGVAVVRCKGKSAACSSPPACKRSSALYEAAPHRLRPGVRYPQRRTPGPQQHLARDEGPVPRRRRLRQRCFPTTSATCSPARSTG